MRVCERCVGAGHEYKLICDSCHGTGLICLGYEANDRYNQLIREARARAVREEWDEIIWVGVPGNARKVRVPIVGGQRQDTQAVIARLKESA